jgi:ceramide synthetase
MLIYPGIFLSASWVIFNIYQVSFYRDQLLEQYPQCMQPNPNTLAIFLPTILMLLLVKSPIENTAQQIFHRILPNKKFPTGSEVRKQKSEMLGERVWRLVIYVASVALLYKILLQEDCDYLSTSLGGTATEPRYFTNYPCISRPYFLDDFYIFKLSYHLYELCYCLSFQRARADFPEYILHHLVTWALIFFSYTMNMTSMGAVVMLVHDLSDLAVTLFKLTVDITPLVIEVASYLTMVISWFYLRLWFFPANIILKFYYES